MSAADAREELEAAVRRAIAAADGCRHTGKCEHCERWLGTALDAADRYATAVASDALDGVVRAARQRDRRDAVTEALSAVRGASCPA
jgi:hypothetical protein